MEESKSSDTESVDSYRWSRTKRNHPLDKTVMKEGRSLSRSSRSSSSTWRQ